MGIKSTEHNASILGNVLRNAHAQLRANRNVPRAYTYTYTSLSVMSTSADSASSFESGGMLSGVSSQSAESGISDASEASGSSSTASTSTAGPASLLDRLRSPAPSALGRKRKVHCNPPPMGVRRAARSFTMKQPNIKPEQRVREFVNEELTVSASKLFCKACREILGLKRSIVVQHIQSSKHRDSKKRLLEKAIREVDIAKAMQSHDVTVHSKGETLPEEHRVYRVRVVTAFLKAGVPLSKLIFFRELLEEGAFRLTDTRHMLDMVPFILSEEQERVKQEISGRYVSVVFDGTTRLGEVLAIILRFIDEDGMIQQRLVRMKFLLKSMAGEEVARELISVLSVSLGILSNLLLASMRDRASVNNVAMRTVAVVYPNVLDVGCISHTLDHVGSKFVTPTLSSFISWWISLFSHSPKAKALWRDQTGRAMASYSKTRWWSRWEVMRQIMLQFGDVEPFLSTQEVGDATRSKLLDIIHDSQKCVHLRIELAAAVDAGEPFVKATYRLEGDGPLSIQAYEEIVTLRAAVRNAYYPNVNAVLQQISRGDASLLQQLQTYANNCVRPGLLYFSQLLGNDTISPLSAFKAARLFSPAKVSEMQPVASEVDTLCEFPFFRDPLIISNLKMEMPSYLARAIDVSTDFDAVMWWQRNRTHLPHWSSAAMQALLVQPSSAAAERAFSLLANSFGDRQQYALEDYVEASVMLQYNKR